MKTCLKETFSNIHLLEHLPHRMVWDKQTIPRQSLSSLLSNTQSGGSQQARKDRNWMGHISLRSAPVRGENIEKVKKNIEVLLPVTKDAAIRGV